MAARVSQPHRLVFIDVCRGLAVVGMLVANLVNVFAAQRPRWLNHNVDNELLPFDLPAPTFQFLIGVSLVLFLAHRSTRVTPRGARLLAVRRFVLLIVLGIVLDAIGVGRFELRWGVLQTLGFGGLAATALADVPDAVVVAVAGLIIAVYHGPGNEIVHDAPRNCIPFVPLTLLGMFVARPLVHRRFVSFRDRAIAVAAVSFTAAAVLRAAGIPYDKITGTGSFVLFAAGTSAGMLAILYQLEARNVPFDPRLVALGVNALTLWVLQYVVVFYPVRLAVGFDPFLSEAPGLIAVAAAAIAVCWMTLRLARLGFRIPL